MNLDWHQFKDLIGSKWDQTIVLLTGSGVYMLEAMIDIVPVLDAGETAPVAIGVALGLKKALEAISQSRGGNPRPRQDLLRKAEEFIPELEVAKLESTARRLELRLKLWEKGFLSDEVFSADLESFIDEYIRWAEEALSGQPSTTEDQENRTK